MIKLERVRTKTAIPSAFRGRTPRNRLVAMLKHARSQLKAGKPIRHDIESKWSNTKDQLLIETHNKCAYCESDITTVSYGDVEHYRPKSIYWWLAYVYDNYLASCAICNQRFKGAKFEFLGPAIPPPTVLATSTDEELEELAAVLIPDPLDEDAVVVFEELHRAESPLIPNPYIDDPEPIFAWEVFEGAREVEVIPNNAFPNSDRIVDACERIYGINRPQLKRRRYKRFEFYNLFRNALNDLPAGAPSRSDVEEMLVSLRKADSEYAAMIRFLDAA
ncbi:hypothetical protein [Litoreibacter roseus]|uniref:TIGR02646 family protein n=1 Tax=Litoreibacter roseus TaxID=2601869 RepID=A0A6N6JL05_9RHOB|nr:hypothetical protein [Litoreibacter roseus]GFE66986.1 hypothetical protein KIN_40600 [Litoreibacter roseus]